MHCCDPLKSHTRKRILGGGSHSLRPIPNSLIIKFPLLHLTRKHKICCVCRQKLYTLAPEDLSTIAGVSDGPVKEADIPECSDYANKTMASMDAFSQNDEDDQTGASHSELKDSQITLNSEISCNAKDTDSDNEEFRGNDSHTDDADADPLVDEESTQSEISDKENCVDNLSSAEFNKVNETLVSFGVSPVSIREVHRQGKNYTFRKIRRLEDRLSASIEGAVGSRPYPDDDAECTIIAQLKDKFHSSIKRSEKVQILTVLPKNWSIKRIVEEFGATNYMARQAKKIAQEKGILSSPNLKPGRTLPAATEELVLSMYHNDEVSRTMPGKKDCVSVITKEGKRENRQKRLLLCNLKEAYQHFKVLHPSVKVGFSTFASLRPKECVLAGSSGTHTVCVCTHHQNTKLLFIGSKLSVLSHGAFTHYRHCLAAIMCNPPSIDCYMSNCKQCPGTNKLKEKLQQIMDNNMIDNIQYQQWTTTDRSNLITTIEQVDEFLEYFMEMLNKLKQHDFIAKVQTNYVQDLKTNLKHGEVLVIADFSENYTCIVQDAIQSYHWHASQATVHPFMCYYKDSDGQLLNRCYIIIAESTVHDTVSVHLFQKKLITFLTELLGGVPSKIFYVSDGCSAQYKNRKNFVNLCHHLEDFGIAAEWHFFATSHGKTAADGIAGTLKRLATKASLQRPTDNQILSAEQLFTFATNEIHGMNFGYVDKKEYEELELLEARFSQSKTIPGTQKFHCFKPISNSQIEVKPYSSSTKKFTKKVMKTISTTIP